MRWLVRGEDALPAGLDWLAPEEARRAGAARHTKRRAEYLLRRLTAKHTVAALAGLGTDTRTLSRIAIGNAPSGAPRVLLDGAPAGIELSLTDRAGWAACVASFATSDLGDSLGCDLELVEPRSPAFLRDFFTEAERRFVARQPDGTDRHAAANLIWSAKESALKVLRIGLGRDTRSVAIDVAERAAADDEGWASLTVRLAGAGELTGWWRRDGAFLLTVVTARPGRPPRALEDPGTLGTATPRHSWLDRPVQ